MTPHAPYRCTSAAPRRLARISLVQNDYLLGACSYVIGALSLHRGFALLLFRLATLTAHIPASCVVCWSHVCRRSLPAGWDAVLREKTKWVTTTFDITFDM
jgi:hypothetical protein